MKGRSPEGETPSEPGGGLDLLLGQLRNQIRLIERLESRFPSDFAKGQLEGLRLAVTLAENLKVYEREGER